MWNRNGEQLMKLHEELKRLRRCVLGTLVLLGASSPALAEASNPPALPVALERALERLEPKLVEAERARLAELFRGWEDLVAYLPITDLKRIRFGEGWLELRFDFGGDDHKEIEIRGSKKAYWDEAKKKVVTEKGDDELVRLASKIRLEFDETGLRGLHKGDVEVKRHFLWWDLEVRTLVEKRSETDSDGRKRVCTDPSGKALLRDGKPVFLECDRWLVMEAKGRRMEIALKESGA